MTTDVIDRLLTTLDVRMHALAICEIETGWRLAFDPMAALTIHYVLSGEGAIRIDHGVEAAYGPLNIILVPAGLPQSLGQTSQIRGTVRAADSCGLLADGLVKFTAGASGGSTRVVCATISASYNGALGLFEQLRTPIITDVSGSEPLRALFSVMLAEIAKPQAGTRALTETLMRQCLILLTRHYLGGAEPSSPFLFAVEDRRLARAVLAVIEQPAAPHTVDSLAALAGMSRSTFAERFAKAYGETPIEFVHRVRLRLGAHLLRTTALPIKVISASVGYASRSYFTRAFRTMHHVDPRSFRARSVQAEQAVYGHLVPTLTERIASAVEGVLEGP